jgi:molecular chaperone DnaK
MAKWVLAEDVGIETFGGVLTPLLHAGDRVPCSLAMTFSTAEDNQAAVTVRLAQGDARIA